jgi:hypothetical protein
VADFERIVPPSRGRELTGVAEDALVEALGFCVQEIGLDGHQTIARRIQQSASFACALFRYGLAKQVAQSMGALDENIRVVYTLD